jgi:hypothetical protein
MIWHLPSSATSQAGWGAAAETASRPLIGPGALLWPLFIGARVTFLEPGSPLGLFAAGLGCLPLGWAVCRWADCCLALFPQLLQASEWRQLFHRHDRPAAFTGHPCSC